MNISCGCVTTFVEKMTLYVLQMQHVTGKIKVFMTIRCWKKCQLFWGECLNIFDSLHWFAMEKIIKF